LFVETDQFARNCGSIDACCLLWWILKWELQRHHCCGCTHLPTNGIQKDKASGDADIVAFKSCHAPKQVNLDIDKKVTCKVLSTSKVVQQ